MLNVVFNVNSTVEEILGGWVFVVDVTRGVRKGGKGKEEGEGREGKGREGKGWEAFEICKLECVCVL